MKLTKNGVTYELKNPTQIAAFKASGFVEVQEPEVKPEAKPKRTRKTKAD